MKKPIGKSVGLRLKPSPLGRAADLAPNTPFPEWGPQGFCSVQASEIDKAASFQQRGPEQLYLPTVHISGCQVPTPSPRDPCNSHCHLQALGRSLLVLGLSPTTGAVRGLEQVPSPPWQPGCSEPPRVGGSSSVLLSPFA